MIRGLIAVMVVVPMLAQAQDSISTQALRKKVTVTAKVEETAKANQPDTEYRLSAAKAATEATAGVDVLAPVVEYNSNTYQAQPTTIVEDAPVKESRADQLRKRRQSIEEQTELTLVERLEAERMKDEERRAKKLVKSIADDSDQAAASVTTVAEPQTAVQVVAPSPAIAQIPNAKDIAPLDKEASSVASMSEFSEVKDGPSRFFVGGYAGLGDYPGAQKVRGSYGLGVTAGIVLPERLIIEGGVIVSTYDVQNYYAVFTQMEQMNISLALKYQILSTRIRPIVGALTSYTRRSFQDRYGYYGYLNNQKTTSQALDVGVVGGFDVIITETFSLGLDMRYLFNLTYRRDSPYDYASYYQQQNVVEQDSYYLFGINGKLTF